MKKEPIDISQTQHQLFGGKRSPKCRDKFYSTSTYFLYDFSCRRPIVFMQAKQKMGKQTYPKRVTVCSEKLGPRSKQSGPPLTKCMIFP